MTEVPDLSGAGDDVIGYLAAGMIAVLALVILWGLVLRLIDWLFP